MTRIQLIFRKREKVFHSIENVFNTLLPKLNSKKLVLPYESRALLNRIKNISFLKRQKASMNHITGHDHYLLWYPFKNTILTIHDIEALTRKSGFKKWLFKKLWFDIPIRNAKVVTTISEFSKSEILSLGNYGTPIKVIHNPLTLPLTFSPQAFNCKVPRILHLGTKKNKNLTRTVLALKGIKCHLIIIGNPDTELLNLLKLNGILHTIRTNLSQEEVVEEYKNCDLVSFVSSYEGFGLPIIEAQATGRPVLTSSLSSMPEVAGEGALLVNPFSTQEIREGILKIINDADLRTDLIQKGLINVERFSPSKIAKQYSEVYESLIND
jgi:glycosyltransferase involved in cell wall biosynthesis